MKNILIPTDFSIKSFNALHMAKPIAKETGAIIYLVHILEEIPLVLENMTEAWQDSDDGDEDERILHRIAPLREELQALKRAHEEEGIKIVTDVRSGDPYWEIRGMVSEFHADLIIIGAKGMTDAEEFFLGSLTDKVVRSLPCPVLTVKEVISDKAFKNLVYATDLKVEHPKMLKLLSNLQRLFDAKLHLVKVNTPQNFSNDIDTKVQFRQLVDKYDLQHYTLNIYNHEDEEYGIVYFADNVQADLIAIGLHERSGIRRLISGGSMANEVTTHTFRPVLTYRFEV